MTPTNAKNRRLSGVIQSFLSSQREGLGRTTLVEHVIDAGLAKPIKQRYYPISPAREKLLCREIDRMLSMGVIEEAVGSAWSSPEVLIVKPDKVRFCLDSRKYRWHPELIAGGELNFQSRLEGRILAALP